MKNLGREEPRSTVPLPSLLLLGALLCPLVAPLSAQTRMLTAEGTTGSGVGQSFAAAGDLDGDGVPDMLAGNPTTNFIQERVIAFSGADGSIIHAFLTPTQIIGFGKSCDGGRDIDGDAVPDVLVGAFVGSTGNPAPFSLENGSVFAYSGATKALIRDHVGVPGQNLGNPVRFLDDMDGDGVPEYGAGATHFGESFRPPEVGEAFVYSGATGLLVHALSEGGADDFFGVAIESIGDIDQDGVADFAVGAPNTSVAPFTLNGAVYLFSGATGQIIRVDVGIDGARFGLAIAHMGDIDDDGIDDYATTWFLGTNGAAVISGATGTPILTIQSPIAGFFQVQSQLESLADVDGDGKRDIILRYYGTLDRHLLVASGATGAPLYIIPDEQLQIGGFPGAIACVGDLDGDGLEEIGVTDSSASSGGDVYAYSLRPLHALETELSASKGGAVAFGLTGSTACAEGTYFLLTGFSGTRPGFTVGQADVPLNFDLLTGFSVTFANQAPFITTFGALDADTGRGTASFDLTGVPFPPAAVGVVLSFAYAAKCGATSANVGGPWNFASNAEAVVIVP